MPEEQEQVSFPWMMISVAAIFDALGFIPFLNIFTEIIASLIFGLWQAIYSPKSNPLLSVVIAKIMDATFLGFLPSNIGIVVFVYLKKKLEARTKTRKIANKNAGIGKKIGKAVVKIAAKAA